MLQDMIRRRTWQIITLVLTLAAMPTKCAAFSLLGMRAPLLRYGFGNSFGGVACEQTSRMAQKNTHQQRFPRAAASITGRRMQPAYELHLPGSRPVSATAMNMAAVDVTALEAQVAEQGDKVRKMKEAMKADANSHTKEELTAEVDKLKILKAKLSPAGTVERGSGGSGGGRASAAVIQDKEKASNKSDKAEKLDLQPPKGTRDFYPEDMRMRNWLFGQWKGIARTDGFEEYDWKDIARTYGFEEYDSPVLENEALYIRKAGEEVTQQLYNFEDKGERRVALRPEMTPSLARMVMAKGKSLSLPLKWFSLPQCWRYERMTRGRRREHYQWNMDIWGVDGIEAEAELLSAITTFFKGVGITSADVGIKVNSRAVLCEVLSKMGVPEDKFAATCVLVDKLEKVDISAIRGDMEALGLNEDIIKKLLQTIAIKDLGELEKVLGDSSIALQQIKDLFTYAEAYGYKDWLVFDASVVRGLAYYTGLVFEGFDRQGQLRAICGGGRYDRLLEAFGGEPIPAVGFGFGDAVIVELLRDKGLLPPFASANVDAVVFPFSRELFPAAAAVATQLREEKLSVDLVLEEKKPKWLFKQLYEGSVKKKECKQAERVGASHVVILGQDEAAKGVVQVKNLATGQQTEVATAQVASFVAKDRRV